MFEFRRSCVRRQSVLDVMLIDPTAFLRTVRSFAISNAYLHFKRISPVQTHFSISNAYLHFNRISQVQTGEMGNAYVGFSTAVIEYGVQ